MVTLDGETPASLVVAIEPILGTIMYEARSHYHLIHEDFVTYQVFAVLHIESQFIFVLEKDHVDIMFEFEEMGSDKISTSLTLDSSYKIRADARSNAQICFLS